MLDTKTNLCLFQLTQRPLKLRLVPAEEYPTKRLTNETPSDDVCKTIENMSDMAQFVYELYMTKMEELKSTLPTEEEMQAMRRQLPKDDADDFDNEASTIATEPNEEPPQKKIAKDNTKKTQEAFKPTPIVNEINVDEPEMEEQQETQGQEADAPTTEQETDESKQEAS